MSFAASIRPPRRPRFFKKCTRCWARVSSSTSSQNRCPAYVVGMTDATSAHEARRRNFPRASNPPAPTWTIPFSRTRVAVSSGRAGNRVLSGSVTAAAALTLLSGDWIASNPPAMNMEANRGRAIRREILMPGFLPGFLIFKPYASENAAHGSADSVTLCSCSSSEISERSRMSPLRMRLLTVPGGSSSWSATSL